jgi:hypothetical protein
VIEEEAIGFLRNYWGDRPVLQRIFDPRGYDFYQGRELSYAIDFLDAQWVRQLLSRDVLFFVPPSALVASLAVALIGLRLLPRAVPALGRATGWLVVLTFLSNFAVVSTTGLLYRATKPLVAPLLLFLLLLVLAEHRRPRLGSGAGFAAVFVPGLAMSLLDRQGLFYLLLLIPVLGAAWLRARRGLALVLGAVAAAACWLVYSYALGPWVIHALNGYWPEMRFQRLHPGRLLSPQPWLEGIRLLADWTRVLLGGLPPLLAALAAAAAAAAWAWKRRRRPAHVALAAAAVLAAVAAQVAMVAIMVQRHDPVTWIDHRFWYYPLPFQALVVFGLLWGLERASIRRGSLPLAVPLGLAALVLANVAQWPERRLLMQSGPWFGDVGRRSALLVRSLRGDRADPLLDGDYRRFYFECLDRFPSLRARAGAQVSEGGGIEVAEFRAGRVLAWAQREAHLVVRTPRAGPYLLAGAAILRPGDAVAVLRGSPPRLVDRVTRTGREEGPEFFRLHLDLPAGPSDLLLLSELPEREVRLGSKRIPAAFLLQLPVAVWRDSTPSPEGLDRLEGGQVVALPLD